MARRFAAAAIVQYLNNARRRRSATAIPAEPVFTTRVRIDVGQSNRMGLKAADQTQTQPYDNEMYASGVGSWITDAQARTQDRSSVVPLIEYDNYETGTAYGLNRMMELHAAEEGVTWDELLFRYFGTNSAISGKTLVQLAGDEFSRTAADIDGIYPIYGDEAAVSWISFIQGFSDAGNTVSGYVADLTTFHEAVLAKIAETYPSASPTMMIGQHSIQRFTGEAAAPPSPSLGQLEYADATANVEIFGPLYQSLWRDSGKHMAWQGQHLMEAYLTQAMFEMDMGRWLGPVRMSMVRWTDTEVELELSGGTGTYVLDTTHVGAADNSGFDIYSADDSTLEDIISGVSIVGNRVTLTLSTPASAGSQVAYGWGRATTPTPNTATINLGNVRDDGRGIAVTINATSYNLDNYALITTLPKP